MIVVASRDVANGFVMRVSENTLRTFLAAREDRPLTPLVSTKPVDREFARRVAGLYSDGKSTRRLVECAGQLRIQGATFDNEIRRLDDRYVLDDVQTYGPEVKFGDDRFELNKVVWNRIEDALPPESPARWNGLIGEYGWDHNTLFVYEKRGQLWALIEWVFHYPLTEESDNDFAFPDYGLYQQEKLHFTRDPSGKATEVIAAGISFKRRNADLDNAKTFKIKPVLPAERLREIALAAQPPSQPKDLLPSDLVELVTLDPTIKLDIRYATENNFMGTVFYDQPRAFMQCPAAEAVVQANAWLRPKGYGLLIHDAYRPWYVTKMFWEATPEALKRFVADPASGSRHNRGCAVDLTLYELSTGAVVPMVSGYDEFSERAYPNYAGGTSRQRWHRRLLRTAMETAGFEVYEFEWWHFDFHRWREYPIQNVRFEQIGNHHP